jgi:hypothetical protein
MALLDSLGPPPYHARSRDVIPDPGVEEGPVKKVALFSLLLVIGLVGSQILPGALGSAHAAVGEILGILTLVALAFIMIHVGYEFEIDKSKARAYGWDYLVAMTAAAFPWLFVALFFIAVMLPAGSWSSWDAWKESLLVARFAAPTSAGVLFSMLAAAGLSATWLFRKARVLAIFDDLDTVLLMIPLKMMIVGPAWELSLIVVAMGLLLWLGWRYLHAWAIPVTWPWVLGYSVLLVAITEVIYLATKQLTDVPIHIEVLLPAFILGVVMKLPRGADPHGDDEREGHQDGPESPEEQRVATIISAVFILLVGLSMPSLVGGSDSGTGTYLGRAAIPGWGTLALYVLVVTVLSNAGKMLPAFTYRSEAHWRERLALAVGMWPRGEVGAGVLVISLGYGLGGPVVTVAVLSLAVNLLLTGPFIWMVKRLLGRAAAVAPTTR